MSRQTRNGVLGILSASVVATLLVSPPVVLRAANHLDITQALPPPARDSRPPIDINPSLRRASKATLEASFDWGDLGEDWRKELSITGHETLLFRWKINAATATKGRWEVSNNNGDVLASAEVGAAPTAGNYYGFVIDFDIVSSPPPYKIRMQALTSNGTNVGHVSSPVILNLAAPSEPICFTDGGLGLPITDKLEAIRAMRGVPALGGAVVTKFGMEVFDAVGIRKVEANPVNQVAVTKFDKWHLGSDTKAMTSMLVGILRQQYPFGVGWGTTIAEAFPEWAPTMDPAMAQTTLRQLLAHRSGLYKFTEEQNATLTQGNLSVTQQRRAFTNAVVHDPYLLVPGVSFKYENGNYIIAGAMLEKLFGDSWENLMQQYLFDPLAMASAGFGGPAQGGASQPWGHYDTNGMYTPTDGDNPASLGPAGTVHASLSDWGKFIRLYLKGSEGGITLTAATRSELTTAYTSADPWFIVWPQSYGWGWGISNGPKVLGHDGSNTNWYARAVVYVDKGYALLVVTNAVNLGDAAPGIDAVNDATVMLETYHNGCPEVTPRKKIIRPVRGLSRR